ncbi:MAG: hypothetical protein IJV24_03080 [Prevotella sp.]|nr:hypothetical protein [Prevotella sp.]
MACILKNVISAAANCKENPAGLSNYCFVVPLDSDHIATIGVHDGANRYVITPTGGSGGGGSTASLRGFRIEFKGQTGQITSEDNGPGKGWTHTGTGRVEKNEDDMAYVSRILSNMDGKFLTFFPTGNTTNDGMEWKVVGNPTGDTEWTTAADTGQERGSDHGTTFTVTCNYQLYDVMKWYGTITKEDDPTADQLADDASDTITITD